MTSCHNRDRNRGHCRCRVNFLRKRKLPYHPRHIKKSPERPEMCNCCRNPSRRTHVVKRKNQHRRCRAPVHRLPTAEKPGQQKRQRRKQQKINDSPQNRELYHIDQYTLRHYARRPGQIALRQIRPQRRVFCGIPEKNVVPRHRLHPDVVDQSDHRHQHKRKVCRVSATLPHTYHPSSYHSCCNIQHLPASSHRTSDILQNPGSAEPRLSCARSPPQLP